MTKRSTRAPLAHSTASRDPPESAAIGNGQETSQEQNSPMDIEVRYQRFSNLRNRETVEDTTVLSSSIPPSEFRDKIVQLMGLDSQNATLECRIFGVPAGSQRLPRVFNTKSQVQDAMNLAKRYMERARSVKKGLQISNLDPATKSSTVEAFTKAVSTGASRKSKIAEKLSKQDSDKILKAIQLQKVIVKLRTDLQCQQCKTLCYVDRRTGKHIRCSHEMVTRWGKLVIEDPENHSLAYPPYHNKFDASQGSKLPMMHANSLEFDSKAETLGSTSTSAIFVRDDSEPHAKRRKIQERDFDPEVIDISSDSEVEDDKSRTHTVKSSLGSDLPGSFDPTPINTTNPLAADIIAHNLPLLFTLLDRAFPSHGFASYQRSLEELGVTTVQALSSRTVHWITDVVGMETASAYLVLGIAMSSYGVSRLRSQDRKGKRQAGL